MEKYKIGKVIGDGTFGSVYKAVDTTNGQIVAIKKMKTIYKNWDDCVNLQEIKSLMQFNHPNIVKLIEIIKQNNELYIVFEYMDQNVLQLMKDRQKQLSEITIRNIIYQTLQGLTYIHRHGYFHRDMKPENLLEQKGTIKIADFGLAKQIRSRPPYTDYVSTRWYRAPEVILRSPNYNSPIDIFAVGAIMAELYRLNPIFPGNSEIEQMVKICSVLGTPSKEQWLEGYKLAAQVGYVFPKFQPQLLKTLIPTANEEALDLMSQMLRYNPCDRPTAAQCLQHSFFQCTIPIPEPVKIDNIVLENYPSNNEFDEEQDELIDTQQLDDIISDLLNENQTSSNKESNEKQNKNMTSTKSGYFMRTARYKPGITFQKPQIDQSKNNIQNN